MPGFLDRLDISTGVFPSGHGSGGVLDSIQFAHRTSGMRLWVGMDFNIALSVFIATIYGHHHYAAEGVASTVIAEAAWRIGRWG
jgi:hypothetical protein